MVKLTDYLKPYLGRMIVGFTIKLSGVIMDLLIPFILAYIIDDIVPQKNVKLVVFWGLVMILCAVTDLIANVIANRMASRVAGNITRNIRHDLFVRISYLSNKQIDEITLPTLISRLTTDTYNVHNLLGMMQRLGVRAPFIVIGGVIVTFMLDYVLALTLLILLPLIFGIVLYISKIGIPLYTEIQIAVDSLVRVIRENITGVRVIKALSKTDYEKKRFEGANTNVVNKEKRAGFTMAATSPVLNFILNLGLTLVIIIGAFRVNSGNSEPGKIIAFMTYFTIILNSMLMISRIFMTFSKGTASFERIAEIISTPVDFRLQAPREIETGDFIVFDDVSFSYGKDEWGLKNVSFSLKKGGTLGIIGPTGSGKSTLVKLLMRLYVPDSGSIYIGGKDILGIPDDEFYQKFGVVFQNDVLFKDTIRENIAFGRNVSEEQIDEAISIAQAKEFIMQKENNLDFELTTRATNLSGGQKQRLLISRAIVLRPEILILDDSDSALDYRTSANLRREINQKLSDLTSIIITQRVSSIKNADLILVIENGKITQMGRHDELLENCEYYKKVYEIQMGAL